MNLVKGLQKYQRSKLVIKKNSRPFGFEATFFVLLYSDSLLFGRPGFDSQRLQSLRAHNFVNLGHSGSKISFFERSDLCLLGKYEKKHFQALLRRIMLSQNTPKSYHNMLKSWFNLQGTVLI